jgi:hypothetical protein
MVRLSGLALIVLGVGWIYKILLVTAGVHFGHDYGRTTDINSAIFWWVIGLTLFFGADQITRLAYRKRRISN